MRICFISGEYPPMQGGVGDCTRQLGCALMRLGHEVVVTTSTKARRARGNALGHEPIVHPIVTRWGWASWRSILATAHNSHCEVLHIQYQTAAYGMHPAINLLPLRIRLSRHRPQVLVTFHDLRVPYLFPKAGPARQWVNLLLARWSDAVIATNDEDYQRLQSTLTASQGEIAKLRLIHIGSNIHPQPPTGYNRATWRSSLGVAEQEMLLCYFGFLNESKGGETLIRTLGELVSRGSKAKLLMVGGQVGASDPTNVAYLGRVRALIAELGLTEHVLWTGYTPATQVSANFLAADVCVLPYRDGVSFRRGSFMAALAHGLPIISTQPPRPNRALRNGENILLVPADDASAAAGAAERLISAPDLRSRLAHGAKELAQSFTWERIAAETAQLYSELVLPVENRRVIAT
jgi:glycosyltransferase involved in cell wall biosynthesis